MSGFFSRIFGSKKADAAISDADQLVLKTLEGIISRSGFDLSFESSVGTDDKGERQMVIECTGPDSEILKEKEGQMIDALQLYLKRVIQHRFPDDRTNVLIDCEGYREESNQALIELAEKLKAVALERNKPVYMRALPPKDRKVIHQHLATDDRVKSRSIGDGLYKKIKIFPVREGNDQTSDDHADSNGAEARE